MLLSQHRKEHGPETRLISATEVADRLDTSKAYAYKVIRKLNAELAKKERLIVQGKVCRKYFEERYFADESMARQNRGDNDGR